MGTAKRDHSACEAMNLPVLFQKNPVHPADGIILAVGIIVAFLSPAKFVFAQQHRNSTRNKERKETILDQPISQSFNRREIAGPFDSTIITVISVGPVAPALPVLLVVFLPVGDQVIQRESVVTRDEIEAVLGSLSGSLV